MGEKMKISVVIPVYNKVSYLDDLLNDLINQTFQDYECLLIENASSDGSDKICDRVSKVDFRFKTFHLKTEGVSCARNFGKQQAIGEYITFVDADDRLHAEYLENLYRCIIESKADIVISGIEKYWMNSEKKVFICAPFQGKMEKKDILTHFAQVQKETGIFGFCVAKIFRKELVQNIQFDENLTLAEDFDFYLRVYRKTNSFYFDDKCYYRYLQAAGNSSILVADNRVDYIGQLKINLRYRQFLIDENVYEKDNKNNVDELIGKYVYFTIFYSSKENMQANMQELQRIVIDKKCLRGKTVLQKWLLVLFKSNHIQLIQYTMQIYRTMRKLFCKAKRMT